MDSTPTQIVENVTNVELNKLLEFIRTTAERGTEFAETQLPLLAQEIVRYVTWSNVSVLIGLLFFVISATWSIKYLYTNWITNDEVSEPAGITAFLAAVLLGIAVLVVTTMILTDTVPRLIKCYTAPRLIIIDYVRKF
jgi:hypothetical protein